MEEKGPDLPSYDDGPGVPKMLTRLLMACIARNMYVLMLV